VSVCVVWQDGVESGRAEREGWGLEKGMRLCVRVSLSLSLTWGPESSVKKRLKPPVCIGHVICMYHGVAWRGVAYEGSGSGTAW